MHPIKHFEVDAAVLRKCFGEDRKPIEHIKATIYCYPDGQICLESDFKTINNINQKINFEYSGRNEVVDSRPLDKICAAFLAGESVEIKVVEERYTGDYILEGVTSEGVSISANTSIGTKFNDEGRKGEFSGLESDNESQERGLIGLNNLRVDYNFEAEVGVIKEIRYGLTNIRILNFEAFFIENQAQLQLILIPNIDQEGNPNIAKLNCEMILSDIPISENRIPQQNLYDTSSQLYGAYFTWFQMLLTFSSGHRVRDIYRVETTQTNNGAIKVVEYWSGEYSLKKSGLMVIQNSSISEFIIQVANKVTFDIFGDLGLGLSLSWYIESFDFDTEMVPTQCLFLYTAIETLNSNFSKEKLAVNSNNSNNLENNSPKKITNITDNIEKLRNFYQEYIVSEETQKRKFNSILQRISQACDSLSTIMQKPQRPFNTFNNLLENLLIYYRVLYKDLFPDLDIKDIKTVRDKLVHTGFYIKKSEESTEFYLKLRSLFIRIVLSILEYEGSYCESAPTAEHGTHQLIYKDFKRLDA